MVWFGEKRGILTSQAELINAHLPETGQVKLPMDAIVTVYHPINPSSIETHPPNLAGYVGYLWARYGRILLG